MLGRDVRDCAFRGASRVYLCGFSSVLWFHSLLLLQRIYLSLQCPEGIVLYNIPMQNLSVLLLQLLGWQQEGMGK